MLRRRVFISHSCKDTELAAPPPADAAGLARWQRLDYARSVRTEITRRLAALDFEVLLDVDRLEPGDEWRAQLHFWLETCDAAIVLLNPEAVASQWVRKEADILMHRWSVTAPAELNAGRRLRVVPVFLGGFSDADLRAAGFGDLEILSVQAARLLDSAMTPPNAGALADMVASALQGLVTIAVDPALRRWLDGVEAGLAEVRQRSEKFLDEARKRALVADADWAAPATRLPILAHHLLHCDLETIKAALAELRPGFLDVQDYENFASRLLPLWVNESLARGLVETRVRADATRSATPAIGLNAGQYGTVRDYINRAWNYPSWGSRCFDFGTPLGENAEEEALRAIFDAVAPLTRANPATPAIVAKFLSRPMDKSSDRPAPFFVTIGVDLPQPEILLRAMAARYPTVTFVLLGGAEFTSLPQTDVVVRVQPELGPGIEDDAAALKGEILLLQ